MRYILLMLILILNIDLFAQEDTTVFHAALNQRYESYLDDIGDRHYSFLELAWRHKSGILIGRVNYQLRLPTTGDPLSRKVDGMLYELDYYPIFDRGYGYFSLALSPSPMLQPVRTAAEIYRTLPRGWEASGGLRTIHNRDTSMVVIYTGSVAKYIGSWRIQFRPSIITLNNQILFNASLTARYYFVGRYDYLGFQVLRGMDDQSRTYTKNTFDMWVGRIEFRKSLSKRVKINFAVDYTNQYLTNRFLNSVGAELGIKILY